MVEPWSCGRAWLQVQAVVGFDAMYKARRLQRRAHDMLHRGFEWALLHGEPRSPSAHRYPLMPPCCGKGGFDAVCAAEDERRAPPLDAWRSSSAWCSFVLNAGWGMQVG